MVLVGETLFIAGTPDVVPEGEPLVALEGRIRGVLKAISAAVGNELAAYTLESPPVFDGLIAAEERLLLSTRDGNITCMGRK